MKKVGAYFTVEAALVIPISISVMLFLICIFFYQYNRCLMEQDLGLLALRAAADLGEEHNKTAEELTSGIRNINRNRYILWKFTSMDMKMEQGRIEVKASGQLAFPLPEWNLLKGRNLWDSATEYKNTRISPTFFIRQYRKLEEGD